MVELIFHGHDACHCTVTPAPAPDTLRECGLGRSAVCYVKTLPARGGLETAIKEGRLGLDLAPVSTRRGRLLRVDRAGDEFKATSFFPGEF